MVWRISMIKEQDSLFRLEIILSQSIEDDFLADFLRCDTGHMFTKIDKVMGQGFSTPKMGSSIWPQLNSMYIVYCPQEKISSIKEILDSLRKEYPGEGVACFLSEAKVL